ncbi:hypothetical protein EUTSA_v10017656mg [Eutrema salsugineum]|uniref:K-box domain-containing protein n=1 Tax=Eutrema salsugineum TaxID=72664 RepID=V4MJT4_EUTSA|nr:hypothetical protein EUTSA_v10017656mg [Eutrema salsugineum]
MGRDKGEEKLKCKRIDFTKKVPCNFCEFSTRRYELKPHEQDHDTVRMASELERLRLLTRRMTGKDLEGLSFAELLLLESRLQDVCLIVTDRKKKAKLEEDEKRMCKQKDLYLCAKDSVFLDFILLKSSLVSGAIHQQILFLHFSCPSLYRGCRGSLRDEMVNPCRAKLERLWLLNERLNGRELDNMTFFELRMLENQLLDGICRVKDEKMGPTMEQIARQLKEESITLSAEQERCSLDIFKDDQHRGISLRSRSQHTLLSVSRKLRRFQKRKTMP